MQNTNHSSALKDALIKAFKPISKEIYALHTILHSNLTDMQKVCLLPRPDLKIFNNFCKSIQQKINNLDIINQKKGLDKKREVNPWTPEISNFYCQILAKLKLQLQPQLKVQSLVSINSFLTPTHPPPAGKSKISSEAKTKKILLNSCLTSPTRIRKT